MNCPHSITHSIPSFRKMVPVLLSFVVYLIGCDTVVNNDLQVNTSIGKVVTGGSVQAPLGSQPIAGQWVADIPTSSSVNTVGVAPVGAVYDFTDVTSDYNSVTRWAAAVSGEWPTHLIVSNMRMPAYWDFEWEHPSYCIDTDTSPYSLLPNPAEYTDLVELPTTDVGWTPANPQRDFRCFQNSPANPDFVPSEVTPQFVLDDALPSTIQVHAFSTITAAASITNLRLFSMSLTNPANVAAESVASDGSSAIFPYPKASSGAALPAGPYITTITTDPVGGAQTTNGMEPIYIAHDDTSYPSAFGVDVAIPQETVTTIDLHGNCYKTPTVTNKVYGGSSLPLVTLPTSGKLAVGSSSKTISVGDYPTAVITYNDHEVSSTKFIDNCGSQIITTYTGAQSALVVNTGSNNISLVNIGQYSYPTGTVAVGISPVAAAINPAGTLAYIANYGSGTISEVNLANVAVTRTLSVGTHPTAVSFDTNKNLWVGGQGYLQLIDTTNWATSSTFPIDGTLTGMSYDKAQGVFVGAVLKNGNVSSHSNRSTFKSEVAFSQSGNVSYSTTDLVFVANGSTSTSSVVADSAPYARSSIASILAYPGQTAFNPPIYTSSNGDMIAAANGNTFTVSVLSTGKVLVSGTTPYAIRGVKLTSTMLYLTMPESNSLVTLPMQLP